MRVYQNKLLSIFIAAVILLVGISFSFWLYVNIKTNIVSCGVGAAGAGCGSKLGGMLCVVFFLELLSLRLLWSKYKGY